MNIPLDAAIIVRNTRRLANIIIYSTEEGNWTSKRNIEIKLNWMIELNIELPGNDKRNNSLISWDYCAKKIWNTSDSFRARNPIPIWSLLLAPVKFDNFNFYRRLSHTESADSAGGFQNSISYSNSEAFQDFEY
jgi:hypothetical protein